MGKFATEESDAYEKADLLRQSVLKPYENRVSKSIDDLEHQLDERELETPLDVKDLEIPFNKMGHGLIAQGVFEDIDLTTDVLNGCTYSCSIEHRSTLTMGCIQTQSYSVNGESQSSR